MLFFLDNGYRVVAHDRGGHGRSSQVWEGMRGCAKAHFDGIVAFSQTDFTEDLKSIKFMATRSEFGFSKVDSKPR